MCDWVLAPSAALICHAPVAEVGLAPLALMVADTTDAPPLGELKGARAHVQQLPDSVRVIGGAHWTDEVATVQRLESELCRIGAEATVMFLCHAVRGDADEPSRGGLVMAPEDAVAGSNVLNPMAVFAMRERGVPMPAQVVLEACDTSALNDTVSGEWLTIAPAFVSAGVREVVATVYPLPDLSRTDDPLLAAALRGTSLRAAVAAMQREGLVRWKSGRSTDPAQTPFAWSAYATVAVRPEAGADESGPASQPVITKQAMGVLRIAVRQCREVRAKRLDSGYLLGALLDDDTLAEMLEGGWGTKPRLASLAWSVGPQFCSSFLRFRDSGPLVTVIVGDQLMRVPIVVIEALRAGRLTADRDGLPLSAQHIVDAPLNRPTAASRILRFLCALTRRDSRLVVRGLDFMFGKQIGARLEPVAESARDDKDIALENALLAEAFGRQDGASVGRAQSGAAVSR